MSDAPVSQLSIGDSYYVDENYQEAVESYTNVLSATSSSSSTEESPSSWLARSHRCAALFHLEQYSRSLEDARICCSETAKKNNEIDARCFEAVHYRRGMAAFEMNLMEESKQAFETARTTSLLIESDATTTTKTDETRLSKYNNWLEKCNAKLLNSQQQHAVKEGKKLTLEPVAVEKKNCAPERMPKYQYYQSDTFMTISILQANIKEEDLKVDFQLDHLTVIWLNKFTVICGTLFDAVIVDKCKVKIQAEKVLIKLRKREKGDWHELFGSGARRKESKEDKEVGESGKVDDGADNSDAPVVKVKDVPVVDKATVRPYASTRDWDAIERDLKKDEENEKPEGEEAMNKLFQQIYGDASDDTRRAMVKSFQTSGGTVLSTNWDEVAETDYEKERQAPKGQEWKNWEGKKLPQKDD